MGRAKRLYEKEIDGVNVIGFDCGTCLEWKPLDRYGKDKRKPSGYKPRCKECDAKQSASYKARNKEKVAQYRAQYYIKNKERFMDIQREKRVKHKERYATYYQRRVAKKRALPHTLTEEQTKSILAKFGGGCALTGSKDYHLDHFIAISTGYGGTTYENIIPLSSSLNASKNDSNPFIWFNQNKERLGLDEELFSRVVEHLAEANGMSTEEFRNYVDACYVDNSQLEQLN